MVVWPFGTLPERQKEGRMVSQFTRRQFQALALLPAVRMAGAASRRTLLFVDDHHILYRSGTRRVLHPLKRHPGNPVLAGRTKPWEVSIGWNSVYRNPHTGVYQLWYQAFSGKLAKERSKGCVVCYAESKDGLQWIRPNLGIHSYNGERDTNIVLIGNGGHSSNWGASVIFDPLDSAPARRYKMAYFDWWPGAGRQSPGLSVAFSPDGIHWTKHPTGPLLRAAYGERGEAVPFREEPGREWSVPLSVSDAFDAFWDPERRLFAGYHKMWIDGPDGGMYWKHAMGRTESRDFLHWSKPELLLAPDELDAGYVEFHHSPVFYYDHCYFALLQILNRAERGGIMDIELAVSRDGKAWTRPFRSPFFLARGPRGGFEGGTLIVNPMPVLLEDEFRFYYGGLSDGATSGDDYSMTTGIGMAYMPRDRFAGLRPMEGTAQVTLRPVRLTTGARLELNADARDGEIRAELLDIDGRRVRGFSGADSSAVTGDSLRHPLRWSTGAPPAGEYLLRLHLRNAEVFALTIC